MTPEKKLLVLAIIVIVFLSFILYRNYSSTTSTTTKTAVVPNLSFTPYTPTNFTLAQTCCDQTGHDVGELDNVTVVQAATQIPTAAKGFLFYPFTTPVTATSKGHVYYKDFIGLERDVTWYTFQKGTGNVYTYDTFNQVGNDIGDHDGTVTEAQSMCNTYNIAKGFVFRPTVVGTTVTASTPGHFWLKDNLSGFTQANRHLGMVYTRSTFTVAQPSFTKTIK